MEGLKALDDVAYVRFASVYKNFREASDFKALLGTLRPAPARRARGTARGRRNRDRGAGRGSLRDGDAAPAEAPAEVAGVRDEG